MKTTKVLLLYLGILLFVSVNSAKAGGCIGVPPTCVITGDLIICGEGATELCAIPGMSFYSWTAPLSNQLSQPSETFPQVQATEGIVVGPQCILAEEPGVYTVFIVAPNGCSTSCNVTVTSVPVPDCSISGDLGFCAGNSTQLCAPSGPMYTYSWSSGESTQCINADQATNYEVTVTDGNGCESSCDEDTYEMAGPEVDAGTDLELDCNNPTVQLGAISGGKSTPTYHWTTTTGNIVSGEDTPFPMVNSPGIYTVTVTDDITGCTSTDEVEVFASTSSCTNCNWNTIIVNHNVTINFNTNPPTYTGDSDLLPYFTWDNSGPTPDTWMAIFDIDANRLLIKNGVTIKTSKVNKYAPGIDFKGDCEFEMEKNSHILVVADDKGAGDIIVEFRGTILINGEIRNEILGNKGLPGDITIATDCGNINQGATGLITTIGEDLGGSDISLLSCGCGNINLVGLTKAYAEGEKGNQNTNRPDVNILAWSGGVNIVANSIEPLFDEYSWHGNKYDLWGGVLSWTDKDAKPGTVTIQALKDITVVGHGTDPTGSVRKSFGAVAAQGTSSKSTGGIVSVTSYDGKITGENRAFDVTGKNRLFSNFALIKLHAKGDITLTRTGSNNNYNPILDARSPVAGGRGGTNDIRSYSGRIYIGMSARVLASVPSGSGSVQGVNLLEACTQVIHLGQVTPSDAFLLNNTGSCSPAYPFMPKQSCWYFNDKKLPARLTSEHSNEFSIFPNPTEGKITMQFNSTAENKFSLKVYNMTGVMVSSETINAAEGFNSTEIDLSQIAKGMYIVILEGEGILQQKKITIQ